MRKGIYQEMNLEHLIVPEKKEELKKQNDEVMSKEHRGQLKEWAKQEQAEQQNLVVSDYNPNNIHVSILTQIND